MKRGDQLRFRGPGGAEFVVTVGAAFDPKTINARVSSGEWTPVEAQAKHRAPRRKPPVKKSAAAKPKTDE